MPRMESTETCSVFLQEDQAAVRLRRQELQRVRIVLPDRRDVPDIRQRGPVDRELLVPPGPAAPARARAAARCRTPPRRATVDLAALDSRSSPCPTSLPSTIDLDLLRGNPDRREGAHLLVFLQRGGDQPGERDQEEDGAGEQHQMQDRSAGRPRSRASASASPCAARSRTDTAPRQCARQTDRGDQQRDQRRTRATRP